MDCLCWCELCLLLCLCLFLQSGSTASQPETLLYSQDPGGNTPESKKPDSSEEAASYGDYEWKRGSSFFPLRGKKPDAYLTDPYEIEEDKRRQFFPLHGKKIPDDLKRGSYFMPMRGRKDDSSWAADDSKRASAFMPMRGKKGIAEYLAKSGTYDDGRDRYNFLTDHTGQERGPREKRAAPEPKWAEPEDNIATGLLDERRRRSGQRWTQFMPMRGRRVAESWTRSSFTPTRNEDYVRRPYFEGPTPTRDDDFTVEPWSPEQLISLFSKRFDDENFTVEPWPVEELQSLLEKRSAHRFDEAFTVEPWPADQLPPIFNSDRRSGGQIEDRFEDKRNPFVPVKGRRTSSSFYSPYPYFMNGIGSSFISRPHAGTRNKKLRINWDSVKRAFHAARGKRLLEEEASLETTRPKRSLVWPRAAMRPDRQYIALKRPMSFFATRGKRATSPVRSES